MMRDYIVKQRLNSCASFWNKYVSNPTASTPKAFANFSPGLERSDNPGTVTSKPNQRWKR